MPREEKWSGASERRERDRSGRGSSDRRSSKRSSWRDGTSRSKAPAEPRPTPPPTDTPHAQHEVGTKWRTMQSQRQQQGDDTALPPLPGRENRRDRKRQGSGNNWAIIFGAVLLLVVAGLLISPIRNLFTGDDTASTPTPISTSVAMVPTDVPSGDETAVPTHEPASTVDSDFLVCIDPGHGGWDFGRERTDFNSFGPPWFNEAEITLPLSLQLRDELESRGIAVVMTRESAGAVNWQNEDVDGDGRVLDDTPQGQVAGLRDELQARINICNEAGADIMVSIHLNGYDDQSVGGYEIYFNETRDFAQENQDLAVFIYREMSVAFADLGYPASERGWKSDYNLSADTNEFGGEQFLVMIGPKVEKPEYTIEPTNMPGVIIETLFVTNTNDANFILNPANQQRLVVGWADGIENYRERYGDGD